METFNLTKQESIKYLQKEGCTSVLKVGLNDECAPEMDDLARLYILVRERKPFQILEFGSGFSSLIMAFALKKNWEDYLNLIKKIKKDSTPKFNQPHLISVESSKKWERNSLNKIKSVSLGEFVGVKFSEVEICEYKGQLCHFYKTLPNIVPDFVYLDGPDPATVQGTINGLSFHNPGRTVMAADIIKYESTLMPGFFMIIDGRSNNSRFLSRNLKRNYDVRYYEKADVSTFELKEKRLGKKNIFGCEAYNNKDVYFAGIKIN